MVFGYSSGFDRYFLQSNHRLYTKSRRLHPRTIKFHNPTHHTLFDGKTICHCEKTQQNIRYATMKCKIINGRKVCKAKADDQVKLLQELKSSLSKDKPLRHYKSNFRGDSCTISESDDNKFTVRCKRKENQEVLHRMLKREDVREMLP